MELLRTWGLFRWIILLIKLRSCEIDNFCHCRVRDESYLFSSVHPAMHYVVNNTLKLFVQFSWTMVDAFPRSIGQPAVYHPFFIAHDHHILLWETLNSSTKCSLCHLMWACVRIGKALIPRETHPFCLRFTQNQMFYLAPGLTVVTAGSSLIRKPASRIEDDHLWCPFPHVSAPDDQSEARIEVTWSVLTNERPVFLSM